MLPDGHPHAWEVQHAHLHLPGAFTKRHIATGGQLVVTPQMRDLAQGMPSALERGAAIAVSGPYGAGKTTVLAAVAAVADVNTAIVNLPRRATERTQWEEIATAVTGTRPTGTARAMQNHTRDYLTAVPTLLVIDEAQYLGQAALLTLRWLWAHPFPTFAIVLAGSNLFDHLKAEPSVDTRIDRRISLRHHTTDTMLNLLTAHHPHAAATDPTLLAAIDREYAHGSWRKWSKLLLTLTNDWGITGPITIADASEAILAIDGITPNLDPTPRTRTPAKARR
ncbi:ATP-binding protein [Pedococcus bigeumensis]|uniref:ATP-binding protein n=1 Tax=Pedococcus bigeumensis TaxID=433644 RepID=UPI0031D6AA47